jgi:hypothetical protein
MRKVPDMKVSGKMTSSMDRALRYGMRDLNTKDSM